jgi:hypothetical protein
MQTHYDTLCGFKALRCLKKLAEKETRLYVLMYYLYSNSVVGTLFLVLTT